MIRAHFPWLDLVVAQRVQILSKYAYGGPVRNANVYPDNSDVIANPKIGRLDTSKLYAYDFENGCTEVPSRTLQYPLCPALSEQLPSIYRQSLHICPVTAGDVSPSTSECVGGFGF